MALTEAAKVEDLEDDRPLRVEVDGVPVCLVRIGEQIKAVHDTCSHEEYSLADGMVWSNDIECAKHGSSFDLDTGDPRSLPATDPIPVFRTEVDDDVVLVDTDTALNDAPFPDHR